MFVVVQNVSNKEPLSCHFVVILHVFFRTNHVVLFLLYFGNGVEGRLALLCPLSSVFVCVLCVKQLPPWLSRT